MPYSAYNYFNIAFVWYYVLALYHKTGHLPSLRKILLRLMVPVVILILLWSQSSFVILQITRVLHYNEVRQTNGQSLSKFRDTITISSEEAETLVWIKDDEIKYKGKMFDVKRQLHRGDQVLLVGHYDSKDDKLFSAIKSFFGQDDKSSDKNRNSIPHVLAIEAVLTSFHFNLRQFSPDVNPQQVMKPSFYHYSMSSSMFRPPEFS